MVSGVALGLSMRIAPALTGVPLPTNTTFGDPCHGVGKLAVADELSAYATETLMLEACIIIAAGRTLESAWCATECMREDTVAAPECCEDCDVDAAAVRIAGSSGGAKLKFPEETAHRASTAPVAAWGGAAPIRGRTTMFQIKNMERSFLENEVGRMCPPWTDRKWEWDPALFIFLKIRRS